MERRQTLRRTLEQERARAAWDHIEQVGEKQQKKYGTLARKLSAMIQMNGLGSTLAFLLSKGKQDRDDAHNMIFRHLSEWVIPNLRLPPQPQYRNLMDLVRDAEMAVYRRATVEAIEYAIWLKRYVEAKDWEGDD